MNAESVPERGKNARSSTGVKCRCAGRKSTPMGCGAVGLSAVAQPSQLWDAQASRLRYFVNYAG